MTSATTTPPQYYLPSPGNTEVAAYYNNKTPLYEAGAAEPAAQEVSAVREVSELPAERYR